MANMIGGIIIPITRLPREGCMMTDHLGINHPCSSEVNKGVGRTPNQPQWEEYSQSQH